MKKKRKKLKIKNIIILLGIIILIILGVKICFKKNFKVELKSEAININSEYKIKYKAYYKNKDVTKKVKLDDNINIEKLGKYEVTFTYKEGKTKHIVTKEIEVKDLEKPVISLVQGDTITIIMSSKYKEPGYTATDNIDGDLTNKVKVDGKVNTSKEGTYKITYTVSDKSKNKSKVTRTVKVTKELPINMSVKDFKLDGLFSDVVLQKTEDKGSAYSDEFIFAGDSTALYYVMNGLIPGKRLWHKEGIDPETALTSSIYINHIETDKTFVENFKEYKPDKVVMTLGTNSAAYMKPEYFVKNYKKLLEEIKKASPDTLIIVQAIPPVDNYYDEKGTGITNSKINTLNYYILEMCSELDIPFLNSAEALKGENGCLKPEYSRSDGIHLSKEGNEVIMRYLQTHAYEGK